MTTWRLPTSDEALRLALSYPAGSEDRRYYIETALGLERRSRGRPKGTTKPQIWDAFALELMRCIALQTGERAAERLARHAVDTGLIVEKATYWSTVRRLAGRWRKRQSIGGGTIAKELEKQAEGRRTEDPETVVRQFGDDPRWQRWAQRHYPRRNK